MEKSRCKNKGYSKAKSGTERRAKENCRPSRRYVGFLPKSPEAVRQHRLKNCLLSMEQRNFRISSRRNISHCLRMWRDCNGKARIIICLVQSPMAGACPPSARLCESYEDKGSEYDSKAPMHIAFASINSRKRWESRQTTLQNILPIMMLRWKFVRKAMPTM